MCLWWCCCNTSSSTLLLLVNTSKEIWLRSSGCVRWSSSNRLFSLNMHSRFIPGPGINVGDVGSVETLPFFSLIFSFMLWHLCCTCVHSPVRFKHQNHLLWFKTLENVFDVSREYLYKTNVEILNCGFWLGNSPANDPDSQMSRQLIKDIRFWFCLHKLSWKTSWHPIKNVQRCHSYKCWTTVSVSGCNS